MSQTTTSVIELDVLPRLEHGTAFDHPKAIHAQTPDVLTSNFSGEYFSGNGSNAGLDHTGIMGSGHTLVNPVQPNQNYMLHIGSVIIEEKVLYLAGVGFLRLII